MIVFKFGGASVKSAKAVKNVADILKRYHKDQIVIVVSAMGKTTNALERIVVLAQGKEDFSGELEDIHSYHIETLGNLGLKDAAMQKQMDDSDHVLSCLPNLFRPGRRWRRCAAFFRRATA